MYRLSFQCICSSPQIVHVASNITYIVHITCRRSRKRSKKKKGREREEVNSPVLQFVVVASSRVRQAVSETRRGEARRGDSSRLFSACPRLARVILGGPVRLSHLSYPFWNGFFASLRGERDIEAGNFSDEMSTGNSRAADGWRFYQQHNSRRTIVCIYYSLILYNQVQFERFHNSEWSNAR